MKILHTSNIHLGKSFAAQEWAGDKLRAAIKSAFSKLIDTALAEKVDLVIMAGDTFDNLDISQHLLNFYLSEIKRLEKIPVVVLPGARDPYQKGSFWEEWEIISPAGNLKLLTDQHMPYIEIPELSATIYGSPVISESFLDNPIGKIKRFGRAQFHIAVIYGNLIHDTSQTGHGHPFHTEDLKSAGFDYAALGSNRVFNDFSFVGLKAAYSGSPEEISLGQPNSGNVAIVTLGDGNITIEPRRIGVLEWKESTISMETVANIDDLRQRLGELGGPDVILDARLEGLALFEAGLNVESLALELESNFHSLRLIDQTRVLPENISGVKVHEKTILGQYLKVMVEKLNRAEGAFRDDLDESIKVGYTLLTGKELW